MKIDRVYISCCKNDYYFTRICVASVRYWNKEIPISLLKDLSRGEFDTTELEKGFNVTLAPLPYSNLNAYCKLFPFFDQSNERIFLIDSDVVWLGDLIPVLEAFDEDLVVDGYNPDDFEKEAGEWFFNMTNLKKNYSEFKYPGFLFNTGQFVLNTSKFSAEDFRNIIQWKEDIAPEKEDVFLCEDQGIINFVVAEKLKRNEISIKLHHFFYWGWGEEVKRVTVNDIKNRHAKPFLIHWYGKKNGLISFLPGKEILFFYEKYYYEQLGKGPAHLLLQRGKRTIRKAPAFAYESGKKVYYSFKKLLQKK